MSVRVTRLKTESDVKTGLLSKEHRFFSFVTAEKNFHKETMYERLKNE